ncbi:MAG: tetratricopeptide repeat protein [Sandaracinaceae bacterium]|nr:tetratricopeptide repeat protein [Sandaracinaceae bacterium]
MLASLTFAGLGAARLAMNDARGAIRAYEKATQLQPSSSGFHAALGRAYFMAGDRAHAGAEFQRALSLDPNNAAAREGMARVQ